MDSLSIQDTFHMFLAQSSDGDTSASAFAAWLDKQDISLRQRPRRAIERSGLQLLRGPQLPPHYSDDGQLGLGAIGEVRRVFDERLKRPVAVKLLRSHLLGQSEAASRFVEEAQVTAQLQHPGIVPVHDFGQARNGQYFFTMKEVGGRTLSEVIEEVHQHVHGGRWQETPSGYTFQRLISIFRRVCETMAYAHARGVVHRDLKPSNIMVGEFGEVLILDWGVAKVVCSGAKEQQAEDEPVLAPVVTGRSQGSAQDTHIDLVTGTPAYMAPEQAEGASGQKAMLSDVYALGAVLYEILSARPPYQGPAAAVVGRLIQGPPQAVGREDHIGNEVLLPQELQVLCEWAMCRDPAGRPSDVRVLATEAGAWLEGARRRSQAMKVVENAVALEPEMASLKEQAIALRSQAKASLGTLRAFADIAEKQVGWQLEDRAAALERSVALKQLGYLQLLRSALNLQPDLQEAHQRLAQYYYQRHLESEMAGDSQAAEQEEVLLREHDREGFYSEYLEGDGFFSLASDPPGASVRLYRVVEVGRRLVPQEEHVLGVTPLSNVRLHRGSYLMKLEAPGHETVWYPVNIQRSAHHEATRPGAEQPYVVPLPKVGDFSNTECYVPGGFFLSGGDEQAAYSLPRRQIWVDAFVIAKYPVTNQEYLAFLNDLVAQNRVNEAFQWVPRERSVSVGVPGSMIYGRNAVGRFYLREDGDGDLWSPDEPVIMVDWASANAYAQWLSESTGQGWRLLFELEREKAGRGVDGRAYSFGNFFDPTWACVKASHAGAPRIRQVTDFEADESVYGVRGLSGNVMDWCADSYVEAGPEILQGSLFDSAALGDVDEEAAKVCRGGYWSGSERLARLGSRFGYTPTIRGASLGFRVVRSWEGSR